MFEKVKQRFQKKEDLVLAHLNVLLEEAKDYQDMNQIILLMERYEEIRKKKPHIDPNTLLVVAGNLVGIIMVLNFEKLGVISGKAFGMILRGRV